VLQCVAVRHNALQRVAGCCSVLQCVAAITCAIEVSHDGWVPVAVCCSVLQCVAVRHNALQRVAGCCSVLECVVVIYSVLQCVTMCCSVLPCVAVCCLVLQLSLALSKFSIAR